jgi:hypothetical protein
MSCVVQKIFTSVDVHESCVVEERYSTTGVLDYIRVSQRDTIWWLASWSPLSILLSKSEIDQGEGREVVIGKSSHPESTNSTKGNTHL